MGDYVIITDSGSDLDTAYLEEHGIISLPLSCTIDDKPYDVTQFNACEFYQNMRSGAAPKTAAVTTGVFQTTFEDCLKSGKDVFYLGLTSGISSTVNSAELAAAGLMPQYPNNKIVIVDTLCASAGMALLIDLCATQKKAGATIDELETFAKSMRLKICHWFTVDNLVYLKRGGRIGATAATACNLLNIKPVMHVDDPGTLQVASVIKGRKKSLKALAQKAIDEADRTYPVFMCQADCQQDVETIKGYLQDAGITVAKVCDIGTTIGSHAGPGTISVFYVGTKR